MKALRPELSVVLLSGELLSFRQLSDLCDYQLSATIKAEPPVLGPLD
jgi:hypothetical protein